MSAGLSIAVFCLAHQSINREQRFVLSSGKEEGRKIKEILGNSEMFPTGNNTSGGSWTEN